MTDGEAKALMVVLDDLTKRVDALIALVASIEAHITWPERDLAERMRQHREAQRSAATAASETKT